jgi:hypothetical protein
VVTHRKVRRQIVMLEQGVAGQGGGGHCVSEWKKGCWRYADQPWSIGPSRAKLIVTAGV